MISNLVYEFSSSNFSVFFLGSYYCIKRVKASEYFVLLLNFWGKKIVTWSIVELIVNF